jgi:hypothetical protein
MIKGSLLGAPCRLLLVPQLVSQNLLLFLISAIPHAAAVLTSN